MESTVPHVTEHCRLRYTQRVGPVAPSITTAWKETVAVEIEYRDAQARLNEDLGVVFLHRDGVLVTVLTASYEDYTRSECGESYTDEMRGQAS